MKKRKLQDNTKVDINVKKIYNYMDQKGEKMSEERDYKYKLDLIDDVIVIGRVFSDAGRQNQRVLRNKKEGVWKPNLGIRKKDFKITKTSAAMY